MAAPQWPTEDDQVARLLSDLYRGAGGAEDGARDGAYETINWIDPIYRLFQAPADPAQDPHWYEYPEVGRVFEHCYGRIRTPKAAMSHSRRAFAIIMGMCRHHTAAAQLAALRCASHFLDTVQDVRRQGYHEALFEAAFLLYLQEGDVERRAFDVLLRLLDQFYAEDERRRVSQLDRLLHHLMRELATGSRLARRLRQFEAVIDRLGPFAVRFLKNYVLLLQDLVDNYPQDAIYVVPVVDALVAQCAPRVPVYARELLRVLDCAGHGPDVRLVRNKVLPPPA